MNMKQQYPISLKLLSTLLGLLALVAQLPAQADDNEASCFESRTSNLVLTTDGYQCRPAQHACETNFSQREDDPSQCQSREGCRYLPGVCYCPEGVVCVCAGGPPSICVAEDDNREFIQRHQGMLNASASAPQQPGRRDGELVQQNRQLFAWDAQQAHWVSVEQFWLQYAQRRGGLSWGRSTEYPPYRQVNEFDTFLVETAHGPCLMEFFHTRWRRANDVRRWDPRFNEYGGCPRVFD